MDAHPVLCVRVKDAPADMPPPPGSKTLRCSCCRVKVIASPATARHVADGLLRPVCQGCAPTGRLPAMTAEQAKELVSWLGQSPEAN